MNLDYYERTDSYVLFVGRGEANPEEIVREHGFDFSDSASAPGQAVLFTKEMYGAMSFAKFATPRAQLRLGSWLEEIDASRAQTTGAHIRVPDGKQLWDFQRAGVEYAMRRKHTLIGDQPGLGKTAQAIALANEMRAKRVLVICPANIRLQWAKAIREWSTMQGRYVVYPILKSADGVHPTAAWTIVSYDLCRGEHVRRALMQGTYDLVVFDESHFLKTPSAGRTKALFDDKEGLSKRAGAMLALTGTPLPNRPRECFTIAKALCWESIDWMNETDFRTRFNPARTIYKDGEPVGEFERTSCFLPELQNRLRANFMVRRMKREVLKQLPPVQYEIAYVEETGAVRAALQAEKALDLDPDLLDLTSEELGHLSVIRRMMGVAMAPQVADYVDMLMEGGETKLLLLGWHIEVLDIWQKALAKWGVLRVDGRTSPARKQLSVDTFISDPRMGIFMGNLQSVGTGTDGLQMVCGRLVSGEPSWVPGENFEQGVGRLDRGGQTQNVFATFCVAPGSLLEKILGRALEKLQDINSSLDKEHF